MLDINSRFTTVLGVRRGSGRESVRYGAGADLVELCLQAVRAHRSQARRVHGPGAGLETWTRIGEVGAAKGITSLINHIKLDSMDALDVESVPARMAAMDAALAVGLAAWLSDKDFAALMTSGQRLIGDHPVFALAESVRQ